MARRSWIFVAAMAALSLLGSCGGGGSGQGSGLPQADVDAPADDFVSTVARQRAELAKIGALAQARWSNPTNLSIVPAAAANLPDGKVLLWSAENRFSFSSGGASTWSTVYDPVTQLASERLISETGHNMFCSATTNLPDGRLMVTGGSGELSTSLYDAASNTWSTGARLNIGRAYNANTLLADGSVLTLGGSWDGAVGGKHGELWSATGGWRQLAGLPIDSMLSPDSGIPWVRDSHLWLIPAGNGKVLHAGPGQRMHWLDTRGAGAVQAIGPRADDGLSILGNTVMYDTGKVLKVGGAIHNAGATANALSYVIDLNAGLSVRKINPMAYARAFHNSVVLPNGEVVVLGGQTVAEAFSDNNSVMVPELFDPVTERFTPLPPMAVPRNYHSVALLLPDARVLSAGGGLCGDGCAANHADLQILSPHYLFNADGTPATRPAILSAPARALHGSTMAVSTDGPVAAFSLVRLSSTTHTVNNDQRRLSLSFTSSGGNNYQVSVPSNPGWALPGVYMLFAMNADGTPSVAKMVTIGGPEEPVLTAPDNQSSMLGSALALPVQATAPGNAAIAFSADGLPDGLAVDPATGLISGTPGRAGSFAVTVHAAAAGARVSSQFNWLVNAPGSGSRYVKLVSTSEVGGNPWASMAEIDLLGEDGTVLPRGGWQVSADSAETSAENAPAVMAIDGNPATFWHSRYAGTATPQPHWFVIDMGSVQRPGGLRYLPREGGGNGTIAGYQIYLSNDGVSWGNPMAQGDLRELGANTAPKTVYWGNLARGKPASQSSEAYGGAAARAVDGNTDGDWTHNSTTHSLTEATPWWEVDLGALQRIHTLRLWNRSDCCAERLANFHVLSSATPMTGRSLALLLADPTVARLQVTGAAARVTTLAPAATGRYVRVQLAGTGPLSLAEVEVFGTPAQNRAPVLAAVTPPAARQGELAAFALSASDPDGDPLSFAVSGLPPGVAFNPATGAIAGVPGQSGTFTVNASVSDGRGGSASIGFDWSVLAPLPVIAPVAAPAVGAGGTAQYTASANGGTDLQYSWAFGDGSAATAWSATSTTAHSFAAPGVYSVTLSVRGADGTIVTRNFMQAVTSGAPGGPRAKASSDIALEQRPGASDRLWVVNPDNDSVSVFDTATGARVAELAVGAQPRSVSIGDGAAMVSNKEGASLTVLNTGTLSVARTVALPRGSQPYGVLAAPGGGAFVTLEGTGRVLQLRSDWSVAADAASPGVRHLALTPDGTRLFATRFVTAPQPGEGTATVATQVGGVKTGAEVQEHRLPGLAPLRRIVLQHNDKPDSTVQARGVPNYLGAPAIAPDGRSAWVPSKQDNIQRGSLRDGRPLDFESTVRAISSRIDLVANAEDHAGRIDHDDSGVASAALFHPDGAYLFVALESSREVAVLDAAGKRELLRVPAGRAPQGLALSSDGRRLYVHNFMDRSVGVHDLTRLLQFGERSAAQTASWSTVGTERLPPKVLRGKQFFYDAKDPRLARDAYLSCASCHNDGSHDGRTWDFTGFGEGLRNTVPLRGRAGGQGKLHWSGNFDEGQDFEGQIRSFARGTGLMSDAAFNTGTRAQPLGDTKAGHSADLDALAAYMASLDSFARSPWRNADGSPQGQAVQGRSVFSARCTSCHSGADFSDSVTGRLASIGTIKPASGKRLGATLTGIDTPTLRDAWLSAPYLHDGSALTIEDAVRAHTALALPPTELAAVSAYVQQIGRDEVRAPHAPGSGTGLVGRYFNNNALLGTPTTQRVEAVDFGWGEGIPAAGVNADNFSVRWSGLVEAPASGTYRFRTQSDDGVRLWVNGVLVIDNWTPHAPTYNTSPAITLTAGQLYAVRLEYNEYGGGATMRLQWQTPGSGGYAAVPATRLYAN